MNEEREDGVCVIFGAGGYYDEHPEIPDGTFVIAADGGLDHVGELGVEADVVVGDFDSLGRDFDSYAQLHGITRLPSEKDDTDMFAAVKLGWAHGARVFHIYGGLGGRVDHTLANIQTLARIAEHGGVGFLHGDGQIITVIRDGTLAFEAWDAADRPLISVFAYGGTARHVTINGLKYEVSDVTLRDTRPIGTSNEFLPGVHGWIGVGDGALVVVFPADAPKPVWHTERGREGNDALGVIDTHVSRLLSRRALRSSERRTNDC
ncbi:thiamine pyrophosphokinase [Bifidobacterium margollesii]|uniref:Thiamine diphosphokinase n=1 Tax=Bifidobacterium margollesii TaxID=2020964 RepID=A0A2N5JBU3_9BIFI|nr:thiamine diphosphokinase [Bifidobacterium margollesii]PLS31682.1 thiamine pyrophosphokinase [Bifidobacterium margollesii]